MAGRQLNGKHDTQKSDDVQLCPFCRPAAWQRGGDDPATVPRDIWLCAHTVIFARLTKIVKRAKTASVPPSRCGMQHEVKSSTTWRVTRVGEIWLCDFAKSVPGAARRPNQAEGGRLITNLSWGGTLAHVCKVARRAAASCAAGKIKRDSQFLVR